MEAPRKRGLLGLIIIIMLHEISCPTSASSCGNIHNISYPFSLGPSSDYQLSCENNLTMLTIVLGDYVLKAINYDNYTIRVVDYNVHNHSSNISAIPGFLTRPNYLLYPFEEVIRLEHDRESWRQTGERGNLLRLLESVIYLSCEKPVQNSSYIPTAPYVNNSGDPGTENQYSYVVFGKGFKLSDMEKSCLVYNIVWISSSRSKGDQKRKNIASYIDVHNEIVNGFELSWVQSFDPSGEAVCYVDEDSNKVHCLSRPHKKSSDIINHAELGMPLRMILRKANYFLFHRSGYIYMFCLFPRTTFGVAFMIGLVIYKWRRRHLSIYDGIEEFLRSNNDLMPIRYAYYEVREMTEGFKNKLGEGGFGSVYKGELRSGHLVAVKMLLGKSKANGQDFINEVATIGRIHHVNVVRLVGFCAEGSKRALIYDFMPNGSLDKFIFTRRAEVNPLNYKKIFKISVGIARGIEYLHRGCNMQILHFDIKPHNVLLDENFVPKISDFGLARLCPLNNNTVSLTAARGTIGYIAPELFYKNIGGVSSKADVYSFGMLLMEMANKRKNLNVNADNSSQIYFPLWIYDKVSEGKNMEIEDATEEESETVKKMIIVALWCIQLKPCDRPSMNKVVEMLEGKVECLQMPPKPCLYPQENNNAVAEDAGESSNSITCSAALSDGDSQAIH